MTDAGGGERERMALAWFVRLRDAPAAAERREFAAWLAASPANRDAFAAVEAAWRAAEAPARRAASADAEALRLLLARIRRPPLRLPRLAPAFAAALSLLLLAGVWLERPGLLDDLAADHVTARGEQRLVALSGGATALLDADSAIAVEQAGDERRVRLLRGAALFSVEPGIGAFAVQAADGEARVLGTRFEVRLTGGHATVTVAEGRVLVAPPGGREALLGPGQQIRYGPQGAGAVAKADLDAALAWRDGRLVFVGARLAEVVESLQRRRPGRILILGDELAERRVSGSFPAAEPDAALASLEAILGFRRTSVADRLVLLH